MTEIVRRIALLLLDGISILLLVRAILSWFPGGGSRFEEIIYNLTEPVLMPFRRLMSRFRFARALPIDLSFLVCLLTIQLLTTLLLRY